MRSSACRRKENRTGTRRPRHCEQHAQKQNQTQTECPHGSNRIQHGAAEKISGSFEVPDHL